MIETPAFKEVVGFPGYAVSDQGDVVSFRRGRILYLKPSRRKDGYFNLMLCSDGGVITARLLHHLVLEAFVGNRPQGYETRHLDSDKSNNRLGNLAWGTARENMEDRRSRGTIFKIPVKRGEESPNVKLTEEQVVEIILSKANGRMLAEKFGVSKSLINSIRRRRSWKHVNVEVVK